MIQRRASMMLNIEILWFFFESVATGRVCIRSKIHGHIKETCKVMIKGKVHYVRVKEFAGWVPDMEAGDGDSEKNSDADSEENGINTGEHDDLDANFVGVQDALDVEEGEIPAKDVAETEEVKNSQSFFWEKDNGKEDHNTSPSSQNNNYTTNLNSKSPNIPCEESDSLSKPPGFEKPKYHTKHNTHHSSSSCPGVKSSRISKPVSKAFSNHGSMIEALVTQIEMGKVLGYDMQAGKCKAISKLCNKHNINFLGIQETHSSSIDSFKVKSMWGNFRFDFAFCPSVGRSGGILSIWDTNVFSKINVHPFDHFLIVEGKWVNENFQCFMVNVYAPQEDRNKVALWNSILEFKENHPGHYVVFGDFNACTSLVMPRNSRGDKLSKLDRFFITEASIPHLRGHSAMVLDSHISDHRPKFDEDTLINDGSTSPNLQRADWIDSLHKIEREEQLNISQQAKVKWGVEADENSKFFHAIINQKRRVLSMDGIKHDGVWLY
ncbi:RNA-directed DNA polymerase, eukaryota [Tanacetum coccineum]